MARYDARGGEQKWRKLSYFGQPKVRDSALNPHVGLRYDAVKISTSASGEFRMCEKGKSPSGVQGQSPGIKGLGD